MYFTNQIEIKTHIVKINSSFSFEDESDELIRSFSCIYMPMQLIADNFALNNLPQAQGTYLKSVAKVESPFKRADLIRAVTLTTF